MTVAVGKKVPGFASAATGGKDWSLGDAAGEKLVLYFYPKDMTSGCTLESQQFRDLHAQFKRAKVRVLGISRDSIKSHDKFRRKGKAALRPALRSGREALQALRRDPARRACTVGNIMGIERSTFLIDGKGVLRREWRKVKVPGHAEEVLEAAKSL